MNQLNVLYAADNNYAPFLGVSLFSLLENNKDIENLTVYVVLDNVSNEYQTKLITLVNDYNRKLVIIDAQEINLLMEQLGICKYRGSYANYFRQVFDLYIKDDIEKLLYLDCDTLITGSIKSLLNTNMGNAVAGVVLEPLCGDYKAVIGFLCDEPYFNAGVMFIDVRQWKRNNYSDLLIQHIKTKRTKYCNPNQDLMNIVLRGKTFLLPPEYNFMPVHRAYSDDVFAKVYGFENYYTREQIENARKNPVILHMYRFLGAFPWHKKNVHPDTPLFDEYLQKSPWSDYVKKDSPNNSLLFKVERVLYAALPPCIFLWLFKYMSDRWYKRNDKKLQQSELRTSVSSKKSQKAVKSYYEKR